MQQPELWLCNTYHKQLLTASKPSQQTVQLIHKFGVICNVILGHKRWKQPSGSDMIAQGIDVHSYNILASANTLCGLIWLQLSLRNLRSS